MQTHIVVEGAREHNLKNISIKIPRNQLVVLTGMSGSGKSSLAFDTIYAEGQRRFMESLSAYARQFLGMMERPDVDFIDGLSPVISIDQKTTNRNPRSTVGTVTEIYDFLRLLYARIAIPYSYLSGKEMSKQTTDQVIQSVLGIPAGTKAYCLAPVVRGRKGHYRELFEQMLKQGFVSARVNGEFVELEKDFKLDRYKTHNIDIVVDRFVISEASAGRISESVRLALDMADGNLIISVDDGAKNFKDILFSQHLFDPESGLAYEDPAPNLFSFNSPYGACKRCKGLGFSYDVSIDLMMPNPDQSIAEGGNRYLGKPRDTFQFKQLEVIFKEFNCTFDTPIKKIPEELLQILMEGSGQKTFGVDYTFRDEVVTYQHKFSGLRLQLLEQLEVGKSGKQRDKAKAFMAKTICPDCGGGRLNKEALSYKLDGKTIQDLVSMDLEELLITLSKMKLSERQRQIGHLVLKEIIDRLHFLQNVGLGYLSLNREAQSLSGGEAQRIRLATQIGTQLVGVLYILDEPSIGLHQRDNIKLIRSLETLQDLGNSVIVVEHDRETIEHADFVIDLGPGAGKFGGEVVAAAPPGMLPSGSPTARFLKDLEVIDIPGKSNTGNGKKITLKNARGHNLKNVDLEIPLGTFCCVTGVSGSGKSSLINQTLVPFLSNYFYKSKDVALPYDAVKGIEHLDKIISINQAPIGRTPRSNPGTYTKAFDHIRNLFAELPEAKIRGYLPGRFSFNMKGGRCEACQGDGLRKIEMNFLPDVYVPCETCNGKRYNSETLEIYYKGKNIHEVLSMPISDAVLFFDQVPAIYRILQTLIAVGLGYIHLGQSSTTLSGGEAQRIKLAKELSKVGTGSTLYVMDEPTTGLHFQDVKMLVSVIRKLVDKGNTVVVIEHNLDLIKASDYVIDLGPEGGTKGGSIIAKGTPKQIAKNPKSITGSYLATEFKRLERKEKQSVS